MATSFRIIGNAVPTAKHPVNIYAAQSICYFANKVQTVNDVSLMKWYGEAMNANLDDIIRTVKSGSRKDVNGFEIDKSTWKREIRDLIDITKQVSCYLKSLRY